MTETILIIIGYIFFHLIMIAGLILNPTGLSGNLLIVIDIFVFSLLDKFSRIPVWLIIVFLIASILGEVVEYLSSVVGTKKAGASTLSIVLMIVGMIAGGVIGGSITFGIGALFGAILGAFVGAIIGELIDKKDFLLALKAGTGAFLGRMTAWITKVVIGVIICAVTLFLVWSNMP